MGKLIKKDCAKIYISKDKYAVLEFLIEEHFRELNEHSLKEKTYNTEGIMKLWVETYIDDLYEKYKKQN